MPFALIIAALVIAACVVWDWLTDLPLSNWEDRP